MSFAELSIIYRSWRKSLFLCCQALEVSSFSFRCFLPGIRCIGVFCRHLLLHSWCRVHLLDIKCPRKSFFNWCNEMACLTKVLHLFVLWLWSPKWLSGIVACAISAWSAAEPNFSNSDIVFVCRLVTRSLVKLDVRITRLFTDVKVLEGVYFMLAKKKATLGWWPHCPGHPSLPLQCHCHCHCHAMESAPVHYLRPQQGATLKTNWWGIYAMHCTQMMEKTFTPYQIFTYKLPELSHERQPFANFWDIGLPCHCDVIE